MPLASLLVKRMTGQNEDYFAQHTQKEREHQHENTNTMPKAKNSQTCSIP